MNTPEVAARKQRSPWFYILIGCGGLAGLLCLGTAVAVFFFGKALSDVRDGVTNPQQKRENALKQLGGLPEGYSVVVSMNVFVMQTTILTDREPLPDGGFSIEEDGRQFAYFRVMANANNQPARDYLNGKSDDASTLRRSGVQVSLKETFKRGQLNVDGRRVVYMSGRGQDDMVPGPALQTLLLFDCPGDELRVGVWMQSDPSPQTPGEELDLSQTVADETQLIEFLKPMNPCGR